MRLDIGRFDSFTELADRQSVVDATLQNRPLVSRTELVDEASGARAVLEYPVKTMNVMKSPVRYQVDTGRSSSRTSDRRRTSAIARFDLAHVVYNLFDRGELILRKPIAIGEGAPRISVTDYSHRIEYTGRNTLLAA